ncbi:MAG: outer membrane protein assembly factor BamB family protein [Planctomycetota bacterium]|jgi:outer membrane protein assembly factor BamB
MRESAAAKIIPAGLAVVGVILLYVWLSADAGSELTLRLAGPDDRPAKTVDANEPIKIAGELTTFDGVPADLPGKWPQFRGPNFDSVSTQEITLARTWPATGPKVLWSVDVGPGYAGAVILAGRVYILDYDVEAQADVVRCLSLDDGRDIWRYSYPVAIKPSHGTMSRTVPAVTDKYVVTMGPKCHVTCLDATTGEFRWMYNLVREFNTTVPEWYAGQCPLIDDGKAIIAPAGAAAEGKETAAPVTDVNDGNEVAPAADGVLMMAVDCETGKIVWQTPNPDGWIMTHSSIVPMTFKGRRFYVYCGGNNRNGGIVGISDQDGSVLWKTDEWKVRYVVPTPVVVGEDRIFLTAGYGQQKIGCAMLRLTETDSVISASVEYLHPTAVFGAIQQSPIYYESYIYGVRPDRQLVCLNPEGNVVWTSTSANKFGRNGGPYAIVNGLLYVMDDKGNLTLVEARPDGYLPLAQAKVLDGADSWGPMAIAGNRMIVRDTLKMICLDISEQ